MPKTAIFATSQNDSCPECGAKLAIRRGRHSPFLGCSHCPECLHIRPLKAQVHSHIVKVLDGQSCQKCPEMLALRQGRYGMFIGCYNYPKCDHTELIDKPDETSITCPQCRQGKLLRRMSRYGKVFYSCDRYPGCQFALNFKPVAGDCSYCHYPLLIEKCTAKGLILCCANKLCGKPVATTK
jgi:putative DNA topoisomerase